MKGGTVGIGHRVLLLALLTGAACGPVGPDTIGDVKVMALVDSSRTTVILAYQPSSCFTCSNALHHYRQLERQGRLTVRVVLTSPPSRRERFLLSTIHLKPAAVSATGSAVEMEYLYARGRLVAFSRSPKLGTNSMVYQRVRKDSREQLQTVNTTDRL
jgi:hypothetical protein